MATVFLQLATGIGIVALALAWGSWVWNTYRPIPAPETLGQVVVHGLEVAAADSTAQAIAVGMVGAIAEHYRTVDFINTAASTADQFLIGVGGLAPEPLLVPTATGVERLDITVEFAGAKIDSKGIASLFTRQRERGALSVAISLSQSDTPTTWRAVASASYSENNAYGFRIQASGTVDEIARAIGLRFVQAHYGVGDPFFAALPEAEFRDIWDARRAAAELLLRGVNAAQGAMQAEAKERYDAIAPILMRYRGRLELQKLGTYLAMAGDDLAAARTHVAEARRVAQDEEEQKSLDSLIVALDLEIANRGKRTSPGPLSVDAGVSGRLPAVEAANRRIASALGIPEAAPVVRRPRIGLVLGRPPGEWNDRITLVGATEAPPDDALTAYSVAVLSVVASLAPDAELVISPVTASVLRQMDVMSAASALAGQGLDVVLVPFGVDARPAGGQSAGEHWAEGVALQSRAMAAHDGLLVLPAGNGSVEVPAVQIPDGAPSLAVIGATDSEGRLAIYSNRGTGVNFYAPGMATVVGPSGVVEQSGTSFSAAAFAAGAALVAATRPSVSGEALLEALRASPRAGRDLPVPDVAEAIKRLAEQGE